MKDVEQRGQYKRQGGRGREINNRTREKREREIERERERERDRERPKGKQIKKEDKKNER